MTEIKAPETVNNAPATSIGAGGSQSNASIQDRAGLYIAIVALILATLAIGLVITMPQIIDAKVQAGIAQARADMAQQMADAKSDMNSAQVNARLALDRVEKIGARLEEKGLIKLENH